MEPKPQREVSPRLAGAEAYVAELPLISEGMPFLAELDDSKARKVEARIEAKGIECPIAEAAPQLGGSGKDETESLLAYLQ